MLPAGMKLPDDWRSFETVDERNLTNQWSMWGWSCIQKVGRKWDSMVPGAPLFKTKTEAHEFLTRFVCDVIPMRCLERAEAAGINTNSQ